MPATKIPETAMETKNTIRQAEWGNWGITFFTRNDVRDYAPASIEGTLYFPVGARGPMDGYLGSPERLRYQALVQAWQERGELPDNLARAGGLAASPGLEGCGTSARATGTAITKAEGRAISTAHQSALSCGCDPGEGYRCARHRGEDVQA